MASAHRSYWRRDATPTGAAVELTEQALRRLLALGLVRRDGEHVVARPALARYSVGEPTVQERRS